MLKKVFLPLLALTFFSIFMVRSAEALTLIPPSLEFNLTPGETYETKVKLFNEEERSLKLFTEVTGFNAKDETGTPAFNFNEPVEGLSAWIQVDKGPLSINPGERIEVPFKVLVPKTAEPGGHYASLFFSDNPPQQGQVTIGSKLGVLLLARVAGNIVEQGAIKQFTVEHTKALTRLPIQFAIRYENTGNVHLRPTGTISVKSMWGKKVATLEVNPIKGATLPKTTRKYEVLWEKDSAKPVTGNMWKQFWTEYSNERNNFLLGKYTASLSLTAGASSSVVSASTINFWVFPWHVIVVYGIAIVIIILLLIVVIKKYNKWLIAKVMKNQATPQEKNAKEIPQKSQAQGNSIKTKQNNDKTTP